MPAWTFTDPTASPGPPWAAAVAVALLTAACGHVAVGEVGASGAPGRHGTSTAAAAVDTPGNAVRSTPTGRPVRTTAGRPTDPWAPVSAAADAWAAWRPVLTGVREARPADVTSLRTRTRAVLERDWTMELGPGSVLAHHHGETVLRVGQPGAAWDVEVHLPAVPVALQGWTAIARRPGTICSRKAGVCLRLPIPQRPGAPSLEIAAQMVWMEAVGRVALQESAVELLPPAGVGAPPIGVARTDSPVGPLDCLLLARDEPHLMALEGRAARLWGASPDAAALCVDVRGMIVVAPPGSSWLPPFYTALRAGADPTAGTLPLPLSR